MPRLSLQKELTTVLREYLTVAELHSPEEYPLDVKRVAAALKTSRTTLYKYGLDKDIAAAERRQLERAILTEQNVVGRTKEDTIRTLRADLEQAEERNKLLIARINMVEANAARLGIDPEELYRATLKPIRSVSHAGNNKLKNARKRG